jgi:hypothetical protein
MRKSLLPVLSLFLMFYTLAGSGAAQSLDSPNLQPLAKRATQAIAAQQAAVEQFQTDRQALLALANSEESDLKTPYRALFHAYNDSIEVVVAVSSAVANVDQTASEIFREWEEEIEVYTDARLKADSQANFAKTQQSYESLIRSLRQTEAKLDPTLAALKGNVTHFKHQLTASGLASRKPELLALEQDIAGLINSLNTSIASCDAFIRSVQR